MSAIVLGKRHRISPGTGRTSKKLKLNGGVGVLRTSNPDSELANCSRKPSLKNEYDLCNFVGQDVYELEKQREKKSKDVILHTALSVVSTVSPSTSFPVPAESQLQLLSQSILVHFAKNTQDEATFKRKMVLRDTLSGIVRDGLRSVCRLIAVGSTITGTGSYNSDVDMYLLVPHPAGLGYETDRAFALRCLRVARQAIGKWRQVAHLELIPARVPILRMRSRDGLEADINCNNTVGIRNSHLLHYYAVMDKRYTALALVLKHWAIREDILDAKNGYLNSYSLVLLLIHFLQAGVKPKVLPNLQQLFPDMFDCRRDVHSLRHGQEDYNYLCCWLINRMFDDLPSWPDQGLNTQSVGSLLLGFFNYYVTDFNFRHHAVSICSACRFYRDRLQRCTDKFFIHIEEPFNEENTARCVHRQECFDKILNAFKSALHRLTKSATLESIGVRWR